MAVKRSVKDIERQGCSCAVENRRHCTVANTSWNAIKRDSRLWEWLPGSSEIYAFCVALHVYRMRPWLCACGKHLTHNHSSTILFSVYVPTSCSLEKVRRTSTSLRHVGRHLLYDSYRHSQERSRRTMCSCFAFLDCVAGEHVNVSLCMTAWYDHHDQTWLLGYLLALISQYLSSVQMEQEYWRNVRCPLPFLY